MAKADPTLLAEGAARIVGALDPGATFAGRYLVEERIGAGGMGAVYRVHDERLGEVVALKMLTLDSSRALERFRREVRLARRVTHPNVARTHDLGEHAGVNFLTMEFVRGTPLDSLIEAQTVVAPERAADIGQQIAAGLEAAHGAGVVHRDLKPANVMVAEDGRIVLTDFGIARAENTDTRTHETGTLVGTPHYMAPEQVRGQTVGPRADLYALGLILYELTTGQLPFEADSPIAVAVMRLHEPPVDPRELRSMPDALAETILRCLAREPDARFPTARVVRERLAELAPGVYSAGSPSTAGFTPSLTPPRTPRSGTGVRSSPTGALYAPIANTNVDRLAVLPFVFRGAAEHDYLGEGLAEELVDVLSRTRGLHVLAFSAVRPFAERRDPATLRDELGADVIVDGTVQLGGSRVRIAARLIDALEGTQLWSERFDGELEDVFVLQESMGRRVAESLRLEVDAAAYRHSAEPAAIELYLRARKGLSGDLMVSAEKTVRMLEECLARAPELLPAHAAHAFACVRAWWAPETDTGGLRGERACRAVENALERAPEIAETHLAHAALCNQTGEFAESARALKRALDIAPTLASAHGALGMLQCEAGLQREGLARLKLALELDPSLQVARFTQTQTALLNGDAALFEKASGELAQAFPHPSVPVLASMFRWALYADDRAEVRRIVEMLSAKGWTYAGAEPASLFKCALDADQVGPSVAVFEGIPRSLDNPRFTALMDQMATESFAFGGHLPEAMRAFRRACEGILIDIDWVRNSRLLDPIREHPDFAPLADVVARRAYAIWK